MSRRNRTRIVLLTMLAAVNYWISIVCAALVVAIGIIIWVVFEGGLVPDDADTLKLFGIGIAVLLVGAATVGTFVALVRFPFQRRSLERRVLAETGAHIAQTEEHVRTRNILEGLAIAAGVPVPRFAIIPELAPNSFGVGTRPSATIIGVTTGLIEKLSRDELEAILAYEVSRIDSYDVALSSWTVALTGSAIAALDADDEPLKQVVGWVPRHFAQWLQVWALRGQAELRDRRALHFTRHPEALISALEKLDADPSPVMRVSRATAPLWVELPIHVFGNATSRSGLRLAKELLLKDRIIRLRTELGQLGASARD